MFPFSKPKLPKEDEDIMVALFPSISSPRPPPRSARGRQTAPSRFQTSTRSPGGRKTVDLTAKPPPTSAPETDHTPRPQAHANGDSRMNSPGSPFTLKSVNSTTASKRGKAVRRKPKLSQRFLASSDISFLQDRPGHGMTAKKGEWMDVKVPQSQIPESMGVVETSFLPPNDPNYESWYDAEEKVWKTRIFPALKPASRRDVELLEDWLTEQLAEKAWEDQELQQAAHALHIADFQTNEALNGEESTVQTQPTRVPKRSPTLVREQMGLLMLGFHEVGRQVSLHCVERGRLLERIWGALNDLFEYVIDEMQDTINDCESRLEGMRSKMKKQNESTETQRRRMKEEVAETTHSLTRKWGKKMQALKDKLFEQEKELKHSQKTMRFLKDWLPGFDVYADSVLNQLLPVVSSQNTPVGFNNARRLEITPEQAFCSDMERLLNSDVAALAGFGNHSVVSRQMSGHSEMGSDAEILLTPKHDDKMTKSDSEGEGKPTIAIRPMSSHGDEAVRKLLKANEESRQKISELKMEVVRAEGKAREQLALRHRMAHSLEGRIRALEDLATSALEGPSLQKLPFNLSVVLELQILQQGVGFSLPRGTEVAPVSLILSEMWGVLNSYLSQISHHQLSLISLAIRGQQPAAALLSRTTFQKHLYEYYLQKANGSRGTADTRLHFLLYSLQVQCNPGFKRQFPVDDSHLLQLQHYCALIGLSDDPYSETEEALWMSLLASLRPFVKDDKFQPDETEEDTIHLHLIAQEDALGAVLSVMGTPMVREQKYTMLSALHKPPNAVDSVAEPSLQCPFKIMDPETIEALISSIKEASKAYNNFVELHVILDMCLQTWSQYQLKLAQTLAFVTEVSGLCGSELGGGLSLGSFSILLHLLCPGLPLHVINALYLQLMAQSRKSKVQPDLFAQIIMDYQLTCPGLKRVLCVKFSDQDQKLKIFDDAEQAIRDAESLMEDIEKDKVKVSFFGSFFGDDALMTIQPRHDQVSTILAELKSDQNYTKLWVASHFLGLVNESIRKHGSIHRAYTFKRSILHFDLALKKRVFEALKQAVQQQNNAEFDPAIADEN